MTAGALVLVGLATLCAVSSPLDGQVPTGVPSAFCWRGQPLRSCRSYLVFEFTGVMQPASSEHTIDAFPGLVPPFRGADLSSYVTWNIGRMANRDAAHAMGVSVEAGFASNGGRFALDVRRRTWLENDASLDFAGGLLTTPQQTSRGRWSPAYGVTAESAFGIGDLASVVVSGDLVRSGARTSSALHVGGRLGSYAAMVGTGVVVAGAIAILATISRQVD